MRLFFAIFLFFELFNIYAIDIDTEIIVKKNTVTFTQQDISASPIVRTTEEYYIFVGDETSRELSTSFAKLGYMSRYYFYKKQDGEWLFILWDTRFPPDAPQAFYMCGLFSEEAKVMFTKLPKELDIIFNLFTFDELSLISFDYLFNNFTIWFNSELANSEEKILELALKYEVKLKEAFPDIYKGKND